MALAPNHMQYDRNQIYVVGKPTTLHPSRLAPEKDGQPLIYTTKFVFLICYIYNEMLGKCLVGVLSEQTT